MKSILMSIQPKWVTKILNGEKTIEVRKTAPKEVPFKVYVYCTKGQELWGDGTGQTWKGIDEGQDLEEAIECTPTLARLNGKVVAEFICNKVDTTTQGLVCFCVKGEDMAYTNTVARNSCLQLADLRDYLKDKDGKALHITDLKIYDKPKELGEFKVSKIVKSKDGLIFTDGYVERPPQSWQYVCDLVEEL